MRGYASVSLRAHKSPRRMASPASGTRLHQNPPRRSATFPVTKITRSPVPACPLPACDRNDFAVEARHLQIVDDASNARPPIRSSAVRRPRRGRPGILRRAARRPPLRARCPSPRPGIEPPALQPPAASVRVSGAGGSLPLLPAAYSNDAPCPDAIRAGCALRALHDRVGHGQSETALADLFRREKGSKIFGCSSSGYPVRRR